MFLHLKGVSRKLNSKIYHARIEVNNKPLLKTYKYKGLKPCLNLRNKNTVTTVINPDIQQYYTNIKGFF